LPNQQIVGILVIFTWKENFEMEKYFKEKDKRKAFAAGWYCGFWKDARGLWKRYKITNYMYEYGGMTSFWFVEFLLGHKRGCNDREILRGGKQNESVQHRERSEVERMFECLAKRFGNARTQREN
jgi:hypothetical protein